MRGQRLALGVLIASLFAARSAGPRPDAFVHAAADGATSPGGSVRGIDSLPGRMVARATSGPDSTQTFAVYLPAAYPARSKWPALLVMDPRGRGMLGAQLFAASAERYGFVVISSYNTLSDGALAPNVGAINAMLSEAQTSLAVDMSRLYIAGLSGTARVGWSFAAEAPGNFAGLLAASAAPVWTDSTSQSLLHGRGFALALTAGSADFNWNEVRSAGQRLLSARVPVRVDYFAGTHAWPPPPLVDRALAWFKLRGMLDGRWPTDSAWLSDRIRAEVLGADSLERSGRAAAAADAFAQLELGLAGRPEASDAARRSRALEGRKDVRAYRRRLDELAADELARSAALSAVLVEIRRADRSPDPLELARRLEIRKLKRLAAQGDSLERPFAERVLAYAAVSLGFYEPRRYLELKEPARAITALQVLAEIEPWNSQHCAFLSQARALMDESERKKAPACAP